MAQLFIRPDRQDTRVVEDLLAPGGGPRLVGGSSGVAGVVVDATTAYDRPEFSEAAAASGVPALVDPLTFGLQTTPSPTSPFSRLPYARSASARPADLELGRVVDDVLEYEVSHGATAVILPYFHVREAGDGWATLAIQALDVAASRRDAMSLGLGSMAVLSGNRRALSSPAGLRFVDQFASVATNAGAQTLAVCVSPSGGTDDSYDGVARLATVLERAGRSGLPVIAWRQGAYGLAMVASGAAGYESGIGQGEATDVVGVQSRIRTHEAPMARREFMRQRRAVYLPVFHRSVPFKAAKVLLADARVQGELICDVPGCCPTAADTLGRQRHHAVRARAHQLAELAGQPTRWRLQYMLQGLATAIGSARRANEVLAAAGDAYRVPLEPLAAQVEYLRYRRDVGRDEFTA